MEKQKIVEAVSQAWCTPENAHKEMDVVLGMAIVENVMKVLESPTPPEPEGECEMCGSKDIGKYCECRDVIL